VPFPSAPRVKTRGDVVKRVLEVCVLLVSIRAAREDARRPPAPWLNSAHTRFNPRRA